MKKSTITTGLPKLPSRFSGKSILGSKGSHSQKITLPTPRIHQHKG